MSNEILEELKALRRAVAVLEDERACSQLLARYGYYADFGRHDDWVNLFTKDGVLDVLMYFGEDITNPEPDKWKQTLYEGHDRLRELITGPVPASIVGRCQHQMGGPPSSFRLVDENNAIMVTYAVVYIKDMFNPEPNVQYQNHMMSRWAFRKVDGEWLISENVRRGMGIPGGSKLFEDF
ncbi:MAG: hypothetical protein JWR80_9247 [Bradyrhizobium sp.]|nr:hypothetical protein [Bradyrhizobium sp.]